MRIRCRILLNLTALSVTASTVVSSAGSHDWPAYGGGPAGIRYSDLKQITRTNVHLLEVAWTYDTADGAGDPQTQPILVDGVLYGVTPRHKAIALNGATGKLLWTFDSGRPDARGAPGSSAAAGRSRAVSRRCSGPCSCCCRSSRRQSRSRWRQPARRSTLRPRSAGVRCTISQALSCRPTFASCTGTFSRRRLAQVRDNTPLW